MYYNMKPSIFVSISSQIQMDKNARKVRNLDINPCIEVSLQISHILPRLKAPTGWKGMEFITVLLEPFLLSGN